VSEFQYWQQQGDVTAYPNPYNYTRTSGVVPFRANQSLFREDGTYFKLNSMTLSGTPQKLAQRFNLTSLRLFLTVNNLAVFSKYSGPNPENVTALGYDNSKGYPSARAYIVGLNIDL
jgi:hypothetical protein